MRDSDRRNIFESLFNMNTPTWLTLAIAVFTFATPAQSSEPRVVCYYTNWSVYRPGTARFNPQNINPYLCTHLIYAFGGFTKENALKPFDKYQDIEKGGYAKFTGLKTYNKNLKTLLAIGGWNEGSTRFSPMVASKERRKEFVRNAIKFLRQNRFDGLDLDWEYPAFRDGGKPKDRENYAKLVRELREEFDREAEKTGRPRLLLTMAVPAGIEYIQKGFDLKTLNQYLDWMNLLTYDYHSAFEPAVNHHAPLYPLEEPSEYSVDSELNIDYTIKYYIENGADRDKLVLGIPTYGRSYTLFNPDAVDIGSPADGPGEQGDATREKGYLAYYEICEALKPKQKKRSSSDEESEEEDDEDKPWEVIQPNSNAMGPVAYRGNQWVGYDDVDIVKKKAEYVAENGLGGIMFWSIDNDDFRGNCHGKPYPLIEAAKEAYIVALGSTDNAIVTDKPRSITTSRASSRRKSRPRSSTTTTARPSTNKRKSAVTSSTPSWNNTPEPPTTPDPGSDFKCTDEGFFPHPRDCKKYFWCLDSGPSNLGIVAHQFTCPSGLFFNKAADSCDFARNVLCKKPAATTKAPATQATTTKSSTTSTSTTTRRPVKLSTKSSALSRTTTTTTTPEPESEEEYEDEAAEDEAQDPKVIKELIDLIRKVGGVEQLEKHLHLAESSMSTDGAITTTPSSFNKKLYQKVLEKARANRLNTLSKVQEESAGTIQNSRRGPQNAGLESSSDKDKLLRKDRPQYTTIQRNRPAATADPLDEDDPEVPDVPQQLARSRVVESEVKVGSTAKPLQYVNIRRVRPTSDTADDTASRNALFERPESFVAVSEPSLDVSVARRENMPEYVTIRRQRPTTEKATTLPYGNEDNEEESQETALEREISSPSSQPQYTSIVRTRSTTLNPPEEKNSPEPPEPTTVLAVQIASLLNSPSASEEPEAPETTIAEATTADATTTSTSRPTTTTTTSTHAPSTRRAVQRRRGSTTSTTPASSTTQLEDKIASSSLRWGILVSPLPSSASSSHHQAGKRPNFLRRTKSTSSPETATETTVSTSETNTKYTRRHNFKSRKEVEQDTKETATKETAEKETEFQRRRPSLNSGGARSERPTRNFVRKRLSGANSTTSTSTTPSSVTTKRPFRIASRRRPFTSSTNSPTKSTSATTKITNDPTKSTSGTTKSASGTTKSASGTVKSTSGLSTTRETTVSGIGSSVSGTRGTTEGATAVLSEELLQDIDDADSVEDPNLEEHTVKKTNKNQRRPLTLKEEDQNPSATNEEQRKRSKTSTPGSEEDKNRKSKKYSSSFKQNQLDEVLRQKALSQEVDDDEETTQGKLTTYDDYSAETALAIAAHQLLSAPLPSIPNFDDDKPKKLTQTTKSYKNNNNDFTEGYTNTDTKSYDYSSTPIYKTTVSYTSTKLSTPKTTVSSYVPSSPRQFSTTFYDTPKTSTYIPKSSFPSTTLTSRTSRPFSTPTVLGSLGASLSPEITPRGSTQLTRGQSTLNADYILPTIDTGFPRGRTTYSGFAPSLKPTSSPGFSSSLSPASPELGVSQGLSQTTGRYLTSEKLIPVPVEDYAYSTVGHASLGQEPAYFTREYLLESPVTKTYDDEYQYLSPVTTEPTTRKIPKKTIYKRISTTIPPTIAAYVPTTAKPRRLTTKKPFEKVAVAKVPSKKNKPVENYDYYDDGAVQMADTYEEGTKVILHAKGTIECLDIGNFPHPTSCKKFISCARLENGSLLGWAYICPKGLSFDPVGGMCNWSAGLGCDENDI